MINQTETEMSLILLQMKKSSSDLGRFDGINCTWVYGFRRSGSLDPEPGQGLRVVGVLNSDEILMRKMGFHTQLRLTRIIGWDLYFTRANTLLHVVWDDQITCLSYGERKIHI